MNSGVLAIYDLIASEPYKCTLPTSRKLSKANANSFDIQDVGQGNIIVIHKSAHIGDKTEIRLSGSNNILYVGRDCYLREASVEMKGQAGAVIFSNRSGTTAGKIKLTGNGSGVALGWRASWGGGAAMAAEGKCIVVSDDCMLSNDVLLRTSDSHGIFDLESRERINPAKDVVVGDHVWLGNGVRVNKGSRIARGCIVAQGAIVAGRLDDQHSIYAGTPAQRKRSGISWSRTGNYDDIPSIYRDII
ncbi:hypothetical protein ASE85_04580 [Sphingobium sp. Leaf26]|uniref:acyltransferase n=1 Tax=Sphingobium sp. Leaf26 TaxID=1735693 RepID=UPI0006FB4806|nr:hypothetical protein [Sphingobium sp. Leaf26]KQN10194.1 hypothetical protein ASE85_04580 [Sphingobium sp. Leaf26]